MYEDIDRENKRWHQALLTSRLKDQSKLNPKLNVGDILVLAGPNPEKAFEYYRKYNTYNTCHLVEKNRKTFLSARLRFHDTDREKLIYDDIFIAGHRLKDKLRGIDFDFCTTLQDVLSRRIALLVINLQKPCIWFRITSCHRGINSKELKEKQDNILESIKKLSDYVVIDEASINYRDGSPMNTWQVVLRNNRKMEEGTMRTLKEMTTAEKDMARTLVDNFYTNGGQYSDDDIAQTLQMSKYSVSALKAHVTMRKNN